MMVMILNFVLIHIFSRKGQILLLVCHPNTSKSLDCMIITTTSSSCSPFPASGSRLITIFRELPPLVITWYCWRTSKKKNHKLFNQNHRSIPSPSSQLSSPFNLRSVCHCEFAPQNSHFFLQHALRPELRIVDWHNVESSSDALTVHGFESLHATDYRLAYLTSESLFFVVSPKDVVVARPRDLDDHVSWLLERAMYANTITITII